MAYATIKKNIFKISTVKGTPKNTTKSEICGCLTNV